jgi:hypothetical protein
MFAKGPSSSPELWLWDREEGRAMPLSGSQTIVGRKGDVSFSNESKISREHCKLLLFEGHLYVLDLHSTNKTRINGRVLVPGVSMRLREGDLLQVGPRAFEVMGKKKAEALSQRLEALKSARAKAQRSNLLRRHWNAFWNSEKLRNARVTIGWTLFFLILALYRMTQHESVNPKTAGALALFYLLIPGFVLAGYFFQPRRAAFVYALLTATLATDILHKEAVAYQRRSDILSESGNVSRVLSRNPIRWSESEKEGVLRELNAQIRERPYQAGLDFSRQLEISNCVAAHLEKAGQPARDFIEELHKSDSETQGRVRELAAECTIRVTQSNE